MSYSQLIQQLSEKYYKRELSFEDYRAQRRTVLDKIDQEHNGAHGSSAEDPHDLGSVPKADSFNGDNGDEDKTITFTNHAERKNHD